MINIFPPVRSLQPLPEILTFADLTCLAEQVTDRLPFDADNGSRAGAAAAALAVFASYTGLNTDLESAETVVIDFLTNLMHLCDETGMPLGDLLMTASRHWMAEQEA